MAKKKLQRFAEIKTFDNVFDHSQQGKHIPDFSLKGEWNKKYFKNDHPVVLELGCGKGEYTIGLAQKYSQKNYIGIDLKGNRLWLGATAALENRMNNVAFLRTRVENIETIFDRGEVTEIWITFPDPQPQKTRERKRLTSQRFLNYYKKILTAGGTVHLKTDNHPLYKYTLEIIKANNCYLLDSTCDLYGERDNNINRVDVASIKTFYEKKYLEAELKICYLSFKFASE